MTWGDFTLRVANRSQDAWWTFAPLLRKCMKSPRNRPLMDLQVYRFWSKCRYILLDITKTSPQSLPNFNSLELQKCSFAPVGSADSSHHHRSLRCRCCSSPLFLGRYTHSQEGTMRDDIQFIIHAPTLQTSSKRFRIKTLHYEGVWWPIFITSGRTLYKLLHDFAMKASMTCFVSTKRFEKNLTWLVVTIL